MVILIGRFSTFHSYFTDVALPVICLWRRRKCMRCYVLSSAFYCRIVIWKVMYLTQACTSWFSIWYGSNITPHLVYSLNVLLSFNFKLKNLLTIEVIMYLVLIQRFKQFYLTFLNLYYHMTINQYLKYFFYINILWSK